MTPHAKTFDVKASTWDPFEDLRQMHEKFGFHEKLLSKAQLKARLDFLQEELDEAYEALDSNNADDFVDAHIDLMVVAVGTLDLAKVNGWMAWDAVHAANMAKELGENTKRPGMGGLDLIKPEGWEKPAHFKNIGELAQIMMRNYNYDTRKPRTSLRRRALEFLDECKKIMMSKADDYNAPGSRVKTADYYPRGLDDFWHMLHVKMLRITSICDKMRDNSEIQHEGLVESLEDLAVFAAMMAEFSEGKTDGQKQTEDLFGRPKV